MSDALLFLPVHSALTRLFFLGQMYGEYNTDLFRLCVASKLLCSSIQLSGQLAQSRAAHHWLSGWRWWARSSTGVRWPQSIDGCIAVQICRLGVFTSYIGFLWTAWRGSHCKSPSRNIEIKSKTRWEERSCQAGVECHRCDEQGLNDFC